MQICFFPWGWKMEHKKIKVFRIIKCLDFKFPAIQAVLLAASLNPKRFESILATGLSDEDDSPYFLSEAKIRRFIVPQLSDQANWRNALVSLYKLFRFTLKEKPHIVHTHDSRAGYSGRLAAILAGTPFIVHSFHEHVPRKFRSFPRKFIERLLLFFTDKIIVSGSLYEELCHHTKIAQKKVALTPEDCDIEDFLGADERKGKLRTELQLPEDVLLVGIFGQLTPVKNHKLFFKSAFRVLKDVPNAKFIVVSDRELPFELKELVRQIGIENSVLFLDWRRDLTAIYADFDLVVLSSLDEDIPVFLIWAMAAGKPIVATSVGRVPDVVDDGKSAYLVPSNNVMKLADAMIKLLCSPRLRSDFGARGRKLARDRYKKERLLRNIEGLYEKMLSNADL